jgi:hypothetical protein
MFSVSCETRRAGRSGPVRRRAGWQALTVVKHLNLPNRRASNLGCSLPVRDLVLSKGSCAMGEHDHFFANREQFAAAIAVELERLQVATELLKGSMLRSLADVGVLADRVDLIIDGRCRDLESRATESQESIARLANTQCQHGKELEQISRLQKALDEVKQRLSDPTQRVSYATHDLISKLTNRVEYLEIRDANRSKMRTLLTFAAVATVVALTAAALKLGI